VSERPTSGFSYTWWGEGEEGKEGRREGGEEERRNEEKRRE